MKKKEIIYYIAMFLLFFINLADISRVINISSMIRNIITLVILALFALKIFTSKFNKKEIIFIAFLGVINIYTSVVLDNFMFLINFLAMISLKDMDIKKIVKIDLYVKLLFLLVNSLVYLYDYNFNFEKVVNTFVYTSAYGARHSLYFSHPNNACGVAVWFAIDALYVYGKKSKSFILSLILVGIFAYFTVSRTSILIFVLFLILMLILKNKKARKLTIKILPWLVEIFMLITIILSVVPSILNNPSFIHKLDVILSRRISYSNMAYKMYGAHLFANKSTVTLQEGLIIDNFYMRCLVSYGVMIVVTLMMLYKKIPKNINKLEIAILSIFPLYLFSELFCFNVGRSVVLLIIADIIFNSKKHFENNYNNDIENKVNKI